MFLTDGISDCNNWQFYRVIYYTQTNSNFINIDLQFYPFQLLPLYTNCLIKSDAIAGGSDLGCDDRAYHMSSVSSMDVSSSLVYFYPRLFALHSLNPEETGIPDQIRWVENCK